MSLNVMIVDDHPMTRGAMRDQVELLDDEVAVEHAATLAEACRALATNARRDLAVVDLNLPDATGLQALEVIRVRFPDVPVLVVSGTVERDAARRCLASGAVGFIPKSLSLDRIGPAIRSVLRGETYAPAETAVEGAGGWPPRPPARPAAQVAMPTLTERQQDVLQLIMKGFPNKLICRHLKLAEGTVKVHVSAVLKALNVRSRTQAVVAANRMGMRDRD
jgi:DNA-binding NarL/FixJ family response regulator